MPTTAPFRPASEKQVALIIRLMGERVALPGMDEDFEFMADDFSVRDASDTIDRLFAAPRKPLAHEDGEALGEGFYALGEDAYRVVAAKSSGNLYAKVWQGRWEYAPGAMRLLTGAARLTVEQAAALGRRYGICVVCGRTLSDPESVAAGIGPVCSARL